MQNPWLGISSGIDPVGLSRLLARAHERAAAGRPVPPMVRSVISDSWARAQAAGLDPQAPHVPMLLDYGDAMARWQEHPLSRFGTVIEGVLGGVAHDVQHLVTAADGDGTMLWSMGHPRVLAASETIRFVPGHAWDEEVAGTNGIGTALRVDHAVQVFSAEHFARRYHGWCCTGAPVHDPETGRAIGALCLSTGIKGAHPYALSLVTSAASTIEALLGGELATRREALKSRFYELAARRPGTPSALVDRTGRVLACSPVGWLRGPLVRVEDGGWIPSGGTTVLQDEPLPHGAA
ncbi:GAF domain-containing protein, partial [Patulibacter sp. S7RM1-6]